MCANSVVSVLLDPHYSISHITVTRMWCLFFLSFLQDCSETWTYEVKSFSTYFGLAHLSSSCYCTLLDERLIVYVIFAIIAFTCFYCRILLPLETRYSSWAVVWVIVCLCNTILESELRHWLLVWRKRFVNFTVVELTINRVYDLIRVSLAFLKETCSRSLNFVQVSPHS